MSNEIIKLIEKFLSGTISEDEMHGLLHAYEHARVGEKQLEEYYAGKWKNAGEYSSPCTVESREKIYEKLKTRIRQDSRVVKKQKNRWIPAVAAAAMIILLFALGVSLHLTRDQPRQELIVMVQNGQKATVQLPDGSRVQLNSASELRYSPDFGKKNRTVKLEGEAYFDVQGNSNNPFIVQTRGNLQVKALGTKFNIKSYRDDEYITCTLVDGVIEVSNQLQSEKLAPHEQASFNTRENMLGKSHVDNIDEVIFWMTDQFVFDKERLENIAKILERSYNVTISFASPEIKEIQYSGKIKNNSIENVLNLISIVSPLQYTMAESHITFDKK